MPVKNIDMDLVKHLYLDELLSTREIGEKLGLSHTTLRARLRDLGLTRDIKQSLEIRYKLHPHYMGKGVSCHFWKGGRPKVGAGYVYCYQPDHPHATNAGYVMEHRLVMEKRLGRYLLPEESVHHNGTKYPMGSFKDKGDNRDENLLLFASESEHQKYHQALKHQVLQLPESILFGQDN